MKRFISIFLAIIIALFCCVGASARLVGDVNSDGKVNSIDALLVLRNSVGFDDGYSEKYLDVNGDGTVNSIDSLVILMISVGSYNGDLEVEDELVTNYKEQVVDPVMATGKYMFTTQVETNGEIRKVTVMIRNGDMCVETGDDGKTIRMLYLGDKTYLVYPMIFGMVKGFYAEVENDTQVDIGVPAKVTYIGSEKVKVGGVEYIRESYRQNDGTVAEYYFKDGKWAMLGEQGASEAELKKIIEFKQGVTESYFSLDGLVEIDLSTEK